MKFAAIVAGVLLFGAGLADAAGPPAITAQAKFAVRAERTTREPDEREWERRERLISKRCEDVEGFVSRWPNHTRAYVEHVRLAREFEGQIAVGGELSPGELRDLQREACIDAHRGFGADIVGRHTEEISLYDTLDSDMKFLVDEETYDLLPPRLKVRLHQVEYYEDLSQEEEDEIVQARMQLLPEDLRRFQEALIVARLRELARAESEESQYLDEEAEEEEAEEEETEAADEASEAKR